MASPEHAKGHDTLTRRELLLLGGEATLFVASALQLRYINNEKAEIRKDVASSRLNTPGQPDDAERIAYYENQKHLGVHEDINNWLIVGGFTAVALSNISRVWRRFGEREQAPTFPERTVFIKPIKSSSQV